MFYLPKLKYLFLLVLLFNFIIILCFVLFLSFSHSNSGFMDQYDPYSNWKLSKGGFFKIPEIVELTRNDTSGDKMGAPPQSIVVCTHSNHRQVDLSFWTIKKIRTVGKYKGDIVYFYDSSVNTNDLQLFEGLNVTTKYFEEVDVVVGAARNSNQGREFFKIYYHKFRLFDMWWKQWDRVMYVDVSILCSSNTTFFFQSGSLVLSEIQSLININNTGKALTNYGFRPIVCIFLFLN